MQGPELCHILFESRAEAVVELFEHLATDAVDLGHDDGEPVDVALAAMVGHYGLPADAAFGIMATARSVGLLAHSVDQLGVSQVIRPRGRYVGLVPDGVPGGRA